MIDSEFDGNEELSEDEAKAVLKSSKKTTKDIVKKLKHEPDKKESKLKLKSEQTEKQLTKRRNTQSNVNRARYKASVKEAMIKAQRKREQVGNAEKGHTIAVNAKKIADKAVRSIVRTIVANKGAIIIVVLILTVFAVFFTLVTSCSSSLIGNVATLIASSYTADDSDLIAANNHLNNRENDLRNYIDHIPNYYIGWNEYNYYLDSIGHDPHQLASYLSAMKLDFRYDNEIQDMINRVYDVMYHLDVESIHEVRSETHTETDADGNETEVTVTYDYFILNVRLTSKSVEEVVIQELKDEGVYDLYTAMLQNKGNKPDLF